MNQHQNQACIGKQMLDDSDLLAALDGEAGPEVFAHLHACPCCAARAALLARVERRLRDRLARALCPPTLTLIDFSLRLLEPEGYGAVAEHLHGCRACGDELALIIAEREPAYRYAQAP
jgi:hypothetical protein